MKTKNLTCCICGKKIPAGKWGNNPQGAIDHETLKLIHWDSEHVCCDECDRSEVLVGRLAMMRAYQIIKLLDFEDAEEGLNQLRSLETEEVISPEEYDFVVANWDELTK